MILGTKFHLIVVKSHLHTPWIVFKFPICNTLLWRMTELRGINVTAPSGYLCDTGMKSKEAAEAETYTQIWGKKSVLGSGSSPGEAGQVIPAKSTKCIRDGLNPCTFPAAREESSDRGASQGRAPMEVQAGAQAGEQLSQSRLMLGTPACSIRSVSKQEKGLLSLECCAPAGRCCCP